MISGIDDQTAATSDANSINPDPIPDDLRDALTALLQRYESNRVYDAMERMIEENPSIDACGV